MFLWSNITSNRFFVILGIWDMNFEKWSILELFGHFYAQEWREQEKSRKSGFNTWRRHALGLTPSPYDEMPLIFMLRRLGRICQINTWRRQVYLEQGRLPLTQHETAQNLYKGTALEISWAIQNPKTRRPDGVRG